MSKIFDGHGDIWNDVVKKRLAGEKHIIQTHHLDKFKKGQIASGIFVVWIDTPPDNKPEIRFKEIVDAMHAELDENANHLHAVKKMEDFDIAASLGKFPIVLGIEGMDGLKNLSELEQMYNEGFRHASLTWNTANAFATGVKGNPNGGLTQMGIKAIELMESKGMLVDVSHLNEKSFWDVVKYAKKPFIASHSNARKLCNVPRNLSDAQILAIKKSDGLIGLNAFREFIHVDSDKQTLSSYVDHIVYMVKLAGIDHVGLGFDFVDYLDEDAMGTFATGDLMYTKELENCTKAQGIVKELAQRGFSTDDIHKICFNNFMRVLALTL
ncbi:dipeptidase [Fusibacter bizertensis]